MINLFMCYVNDSVHTVDNWNAIYNKSFMGTFDYKKVSCRMKVVILISDSVKDTSYGVKIWFKWHRKGTDKGRDKEQGSD